VFIDDYILVGEEELFTNEWLLGNPHTITNVFKEVSDLSILPSTKLLNVTKDTHSLSMFKLLCNFEVDAILDWIFK
jgi:hypothetical protein